MTKLDKITEIIGINAKDTKAIYDFHLERSGEAEAIEWVGRVFVLKMATHLLNLDGADAHQFLNTLLEEEIEDKLPGDKNDIN